MLDSWVEAGYQFRSRSGERVMSTPNTHKNPICCIVTLIVGLLFPQLSLSSPVDLISNTGGKTIWQPLLKKLEMFSSRPLSLDTHTIQGFCIDHWTKYWCDIKSCSTKLTAIAHTAFVSKTHTSTELTVQSAHIRLRKCLLWPWHTQISSSCTGSLNENRS